MLRDKIIERIMEDIAVWILKKIAIWFCKHKGEIIAKLTRLKSILNEKVEISKKREAHIIEDIPQKRESETRLKEFFSREQQAISSGRWFFGRGIVSPLLPLEKGVLLYLLEKGDYFKGDMQKRSIEYE